MKIKYPKFKSLEFIKDYFFKHKLSIIYEDKNFDSNIFPPNFYDLYFLHQTILLNKRFKILEIGTGWSSLIISHAHKVNFDKYGKEVSKKKLGKYNFTILDNYKKYINISKKRNLFIGNKFTNYCTSKVVMSEFNGKYCTHFTDFPKLNPDLIFLDGPDQFNIDDNKNFKFNINSDDLMPMSSDILKIEFFLTPGTIIIVDGRGANANFMKLNFQRNWEYREIHDLHFFYLKEKVFGQRNLDCLNFYEK